MNRPYYVACLAEAYEQGEQAEEGLNMLAEALARMDNTEEREYEAELYRLKGQLTLQAHTSLNQVSDKSKPSQSKSEDPQHAAPSIQDLTPSTQAEAEACFHKAIEIARKQQAKSLELRAAMSLARLWQRQGKRQQAYELLTPVYNWFTEGFDTKDLQEAKALLEDLT